MVPNTRQRSYVSYISTFRTHLKLREMNCTYLSMVHVMARYAIAKGGRTYRACALNRRHVLKIAAFRVPARGRCRFADMA